MATVTLSHDGFARQFFVRRTIDKHCRKPCKWCGNAPGRFQYGIEPESISGRKNWLDGGFCSKSCFESYHH